MSNESIESNSPIKPLPRPHPEPVKPIQPIDWWRCLRRGPVSGRYEGKNCPGNRILDLRVDIDPVNNEAPVLDRISGDFYKHYEFRWFDRTHSWRVYHESWIIDSPKVDWDRCQVVITGALRYWKGIHLASEAKIRIPWGTFTAAGPAKVEITNSKGEVEIFTCARMSNSFRDVDLEVDIAERVNQAPALPTYDTHGHDTRPAGINQRIMDMSSAYQEAGINFTIDSNHTVVDDSDAAFNSWSVAELHDAMETHYSRFPGQWPKWKMWGFLAGRFTNPGTGGIMFDWAGAHEPPQRQGFAVFRDHQWFNNLTENPTSQAEQWAMRHFLYTWVHEAGHAFNFMHSWDKGRASSLSWMNYDWKYDAIEGADQFWSNFEFRFDAEELLHMRHGDRASVIMGGDDWASGGHLEDGGDFSSEVLGTAPLELKLASQGYFDFMEPVTVELRLRNLIEGASVPIDARLQPDYGNVRIAIQKPNGSITHFHPPICQVGSKVSRDLQGHGSKGPDRYAELLNLSFGGEGFNFDNPGVYKIRAVYQGFGGAVFVSNVHSIRIGLPENKDVDRFAQDFFNMQVGLALSFGGSRSQHLQNGMDTLQQICEQTPDSDRSAKISVDIARTLSKPFFSLNEKNKLVAKEPTEQDRQGALKITDGALSKYQSLGSDDRRHNFAYTELAEVRLQCLSDLGDSAKAKEESGILLKQLKERSVKPLVIDEISKKLNV